MNNDAIRFFHEKPTSKEEPISARDSKTSSKVTVDKGDKLLESFPEKNYKKITGTDSKQAVEKDKPDHQTQVCKIARDDNFSCRRMSPLPTLVK